MSTICVRVGEADFDPAAEIAALEVSGVGGLATFIGVVRGEGGLIDLHLDHYAAMTQAELGRIAVRAAERWPLLAIRIFHRYGTLKPGERIVFVGTASRHRTEALESCAFLIDCLKNSAPFWKKERFEYGREQWVESQAVDSVQADGGYAEG